MSHPHHKPPPCQRADCQAKMNELKLLRVFARRLLTPLKVLASEEDDRDLFKTCIEVSDILDRLSELDPGHPEAKA